jgi:hypothetical protein
MWSTGLYQLLFAMLFLHTSLQRCSFVIPKSKSLNFLDNKVTSFLFPAQQSRWPQFESELY